MSIVDKWMDEYSRWMDRSINGWIEQIEDGCTVDRLMDESMTSVYMDGWLGVKHI